MDADGSNQRQLTHSPNEESGSFEKFRHIELLMHSLYSPDVHGPTNIFPTWLPDGQRLAFCSITHASYAIWVRDMNSGNLTRLTYPGEGFHPQANCPFWSPSSDQIAYWLGVNVGPGSMDERGSADGHNTRWDGDQWLAPWFAVYRAVYGG